MTSNIAPVDYNAFLLKRLSHSVISSVVSQLLILVVFVFICNFRLLHPLESSILTIKVFTSFTTWIFLLPYLCIIFAQSVICGKHYICRPSYSTTRFQKFTSMFSLQNWMMLLLNLIFGGLLTLIILHLKDSSLKDMFTFCNCVKEDNFFLILGGIWTGFYYFYVIHISDIYPVFPVIYQRKMLQVKSKLLPLFRDSCILAIAPAISFVIFYSIFGQIIFNKFVQFFEIEIYESDTRFMIYIYLWRFGVLYCFKMNLMRTLFNTFLTDPVTFPLHRSKDTSFYLQDSINMTNLSIIQSLGSLDLYNLSQYSLARRKILFTLSQPGGHPHNWNSLVQNILKLFSSYIEIMHSVVETCEISTKKTEAPLIEAILPELVSPNKFANIRNMSLMSDMGVPDVVELNVEPLPIFTFPKKIMEKCKQKIQEVYSFLKMFFGINFLFGVLPQANIDTILSNGQVIIWCCQGVAELACASLTEDNYGIVQKDLPAIITTLVELNQNFEKLNKLPVLTRKIMDHHDYNFKMKNAIVAALRRSLFNIYCTFGDYLKELPLNKSVISHLHTVFKN